MIVGNALEIGIQLEYVIELDSPGGLFNFIIDDKLIPGKGTVIDLYVVISSLKDSLKSQLLEGVDDIGNIPLEKMDFSDGAPENVVWLDACELSDYGCVFWLAFDGDFDRFFYSIDFEESIQEKRFTRGTIENLINALPDANKLRVDFINEKLSVTNVIL